MSDRGTMAKDANHVYFKDHIVTGLNTAGTIYLANNFCKDSNHVCYGNATLKQADAATFVHIMGYYASDKKHLYYKQQLVPGANIRTLKPIKYDSTQNNLPDEYLRDQQHVYFKGNLIEGAKPENFKLINVPDDQWHTQYAFDGKYYFYEHHRISVNNDEQQTHLKLLSLDKGFGWHGLFYQQAAIYCYDTDRHELVSLGKRDNNAPFNKIDRGIFTDGKHVYFTFGKWNKTGGRTPHYTGHTTGLCRVKGADPQNFKAVGNFITQNKAEGTLYRSGNSTFFHPTYRADGNYSPALLLLKADGTIKDLPLDDALYKYIKDYNGPSIFSLEYYKSLFKSGSDNEDD